MTKGTLKLSSSVIEVVKPIITFPEYEELINEANRVADYIDSIELTDDNIQEVKGVLAKANRAIKELNDKRIAIKKEIMNPYDDFANQIKEIESIVKKADTRLRSEVRSVEEKERYRKREDIREIWNKRINQYEYAKLMDFEDFIQNKHMNKTTTMKSVEDEMVKFLESSENDLSLLAETERKNEAFELYKESKDLGIVINTIKKKVEQEERNKEILKEVETEETYIFTIKGKKDKNFVEMLLKENEIEFDVKEI